MPVSTMVSAPSTAMAPPDRPDPAPRGTTGTRCSVASRMIALTSAVLVGNATPRGMPGCMYSVSSQRYASVSTASVSSRSSGRAARSAVRKSAVDVVAGRRPGSRRRG